MADVIAIKHQSMYTARMQACFDKVGNGRLAGAGEAGKPQHRRLLMHEAATRLLAHGDRLMMNVGCTSQSEIDHAASDGLVAAAIDQDESTGRTLIGVAVEGYRPRDRQVTDDYLVQAQPLCSKLCETVGVDAMLELSHGRGQRDMVDFHQIGTAREQRLR